jgi:hypothetical protein
MIWNGHEERPRSQPRNIAQGCSLMKVRTWGLQMPHRHVPRSSLRGLILFVAMQRVSLVYLSKGGQGCRVCSFLSPSSAQPTVKSE